MFENNPDYDFDEDLQQNHPNSNKLISRKQHMQSVRYEPFKKLSPVIKKVNTSLPKRVVTRKFPGPAGVLPDDTEFSSTVLSKNLNREVRNDEIPCSQTSLAVFEASPWIKLNEEHQILVNIYNIKWIKHKARLNKLNNEKAPFLGAVIQNIECFGEKNPVVNVVLKDVTGEIQGSIVHGLYEEYSDSLVVGSAIVLRQFGVLTTGSNNNHYLTITPNNLVTIYSKNTDSEVIVNRVQTVSTANLNCEASPLQTHLQSNQTKDKTSVVLNSSQIVVNTNEEDAMMWQNALDGLDADSFFEDF